MYAKATVALDIPASYRYTNALCKLTRSSFSRLVQLGTQPGGIPPPPLPTKAGGGQERDWRKVRKQWFDLKDRAKKLKSQMEATGGGPKPTTSPALELAMEVIAREAMEGIRGRNTELNPLDQDTVEMPQDSSQESQELPPPPSTSCQPPASTSTSAASHLEGGMGDTTTGSLVALQQQVNQLQLQVEMLGKQPSSLQRATELRQLKYQEELLNLEKRKLDLQFQSLEVQKKQLAALEALGVHSVQSLLQSMTEQ